MRFIPKASLRVSSQITASSYILERHLWVTIPSNLKALSLGSELGLALQTNWLYYCGYLETVWPHACTDTQWNTKHLYDFMQWWINVEDYGIMLYKCFVFAGQEDFLSNTVHFSNVVSMLGQRRRRWPNIKTVLGECLVGVVSILVIRLLNQPHCTVCWRLTRMRV